MVFGDRRALVEVHNCRLDASGVVHACLYLLLDGTDGVTVDGAKVVTADIVCTNGVIHVIHAALLPKA